MSVGRWNLLKDSVKDLAKASVKDGDRPLFSLAGAVIAGIAIVFIFVHSEAAVGAGVISLLGFFCLLIGNSQTFESLSAGPSGINARIRQLDEKTSALKKLAKTFAKYQVRMLASSWGEDPKRSDIEKAAIINDLREMGLDDASLKEVSLADRDYVNMAYCMAILSQLKDREFYSRISAHPITPAECRDYLRQFDCQEVGNFKPLLRDYEHYDRTGEHLRPAVWHERAAW